MDIDALVEEFAVADGPISLKIDWTLMMHPTTIVGAPAAVIVFYLPAISKLPSIWPTRLEVG